VRAGRELAGSSGFLKVFLIKGMPSFALSRILLTLLPLNKISRIPPSCRPAVATFAIRLPQIT
jgi:hypothetical protein